MSLFSNKKNQRQSKKKNKIFQFYSLVFLIIVLLSCSLTLSSKKTDSDYPYNSTWSLVFEDNFDGSQLNPQYWTAIERGAAWNNEDQAYTPDNVSVSDGFLKIVSKKEKWTGPTNLPYHPSDPGTVTKNYTSGQVWSKNKVNWTYGKFEIRARMEDTPGMLNALWMVTESDIWPPEIDITEILGNEPKNLYTTNHYGTQSNHKSKSSKYSSSKPLGEEFHIYAVEWEPNMIRWYLDGKEVFRSTKGVPDEPLYMIFCPAIGPDWTGDPNGQSKFPLLFEVDWIRVYQKN